jgi:hypothetical protein
MNNFIKRFLRAAEKNWISIFAISLCGAALFLSFCWLIMRLGISLYLCVLASIVGFYFIYKNWE